MTSKLNLIHLPEPLLEFKYGQTLVYPRDGFFYTVPWTAGGPKSTMVQSEPRLAWTGLSAGPNRSRLHRCSATSKGGEGD